MKRLTVVLLCAATRLAGQELVVHPEVTHPADTVLPTAAHWPLRVRTTAPTFLSVLLAPVAPDAAPLRAESLIVRADTTFRPLHGPARAPLSPGIYRLEWTSRDAGSGERTVRVRVIAVDKVVADTQPLPPSLDRGAFLPETTWVRSRRPGFLIIAGIGAATVATVFAFEEDKVSPATIAIPAALTLGGLIAFLRGKTMAEVNTVNVAHNRQLVAADVAARQSIAGANARARAGATVRVRVVDQP